MAILIVTDIFGYTDHIDRFATSLGSGVQVLSPFIEEPNSVSESDCYELFLAQCGHRLYADKVSAAISEYKPKLIIGFSAGGAAAWIALSEQGASHSVEQLIAFYPSQIRNHLNIKPSCDVSIFFAQVESHFDVEPVIEQLKDKKGLDCIRTRYLHGFMNKLSGNYDEYAYSHYQYFCQREARNYIEVVQREAEFS
ncbi:dienelactone hydrolase family protein [Pseudoalteromonas piscicida]|uniref:dienelactone hydrolase family protein n=1 Tax=Pseudoalteromonas piscicida TaxID=43662 RepID=UPI0027E44F89|nr:dienelactone hydrolase family protein [Pseudoalteromonas piscicida]WMO13773.1 dienelactone hydrolase family protein [Pseudoalteromonas piscicida]